MRGIETVIDEYLKHMQRRTDAYELVRADSRSLSAKFRRCMEAGDLEAAAACGEELADAVDHVCAVGRQHVKSELEFVRDLVFYCALCKNAEATAVLRDHAGIPETLDSFITEEIAYLDPEQTSP
ncbi:MAG TPA: hypothetical protein VMJ34_22170 [Bryobacteraceae bacterium]|nr:hypothetical protein [Bryobacteraceae bacterium]